MATAGGDSAYVNDRPNIVHLHRLRALCDAVVVGAGTVASDDPRLTTRHVAGPSPARVVIDARGTLPVSHGLFNDAAAPTWVAGPFAEGERRGLARCLPLPRAAEGRCDPASLLHALHGLGLHTVFVEGGGVTVSRFVAAGVVDRLHLAVAPLLIGEGRPGLRLPPRENLRECPRPPATIVQMGEDVLFDLDLRCAAARDGSHASAGRLPTTTTAP